MPSRRSAAIRWSTGSNLPAQIEIYAEPGDEYELLFIAKGGGSANKSFLYQETKPLLNPASMLRFVEEKLKSTALCIGSLEEPRHKPAGGCAASSSRGIGRFG